MGKRNYLIEGVSGTGKTSVAEELQRRGYHVLHGDRELKYQGDPKTGEVVDEPVHESERDKAIWQQEHHHWDINKVKSVIADHSKAISFFCGGSRNFSKFMDDSTAKRVATKSQKFNILNPCSEKTPNTNSPH